ncbi:MAG: DUF2254 domain-containing protein [Salinisphaera sp.]|jgi:uncharacterized membrane protein|nr:DUF2254 domain-containing protein [Salinisphaera sp.]
MRARLSEFFSLAQSSFWFLPAIMMVVGVLLFACTLTIDEQGWLSGPLQVFFYSGGVNNAGNLLQTLTGAMVAIATVVFSTMMVVLTLATSQFGHRLIRSFMRDRSNQAVLGIFLATFTYCLLVFHMVGNDPKNTFVPSVSLSVGFALAVFSTCTLIYFTHHIAQLVSAPEVLEAVAIEFDEAIDRLCPKGPDNAPDGATAPTLGHGTQNIRTRHGGYLQTVGRQSLRDVAAEHDVVIEAVVTFGDYVMPGSVIARIHGCELDKSVAEHVEREFVFGRNRLTENDLVFAINQIAEIAVRALSPALNNPYTAVDCVNRIGWSLAVLMSRPLPAEVLTDRHNEMRLVLRLPDFHDLLDAAFAPIRNYGRNSVLTMRAMLLVLAKLAPLTRREVGRRALARHAEAIRAAADHGLTEQIDIERIHAVFEQTQQIMEGISSIRPTYRTDA